MPKFSIIVPVYNVEQYLQQCLDSILGQSSADTEIILVNDGSTDRSPAMCDAYADKDARVRVIHKKNGGLSSARNAGLELAEGEYIIFLDSDDWLEPDFAQRIDECLKGSSEPPDAVLVTVRAYNEQTNTSQLQLYSFPKERTLTGVEAFRLLYNDHAFWGAAWQFVVKRSFLTGKQLRFIDGIFHEDERYTPELILSAGSIVWCEGAVYVNRSGRANSIINSLNIKKEFDKLFIISDLVKWSGSPMLEPGKSELIRIRCSQLYLGVLAKLQDYLNSGDKRAAELAAKLNEFNFILKYNPKPKFVLLHYLQLVAGSKNTSRLLKKIL